MSQPNGGPSYIITILLGRDTNHTNGFGEMIEIDGNCQQPSQNVCNCRGQSPGLVLCTYRASRALQTHSIYVSDSLDGCVADGTLTPLVSSSPIPHEMRIKTTIVSVSHLSA